MIALLTQRVRFDILDCIDYRTQSAASFLPTVCFRVYLLNMFDIKQFISALKQIAEEKGIAEEKILETIELAIAAAYKKDYGEKGQIVRAKLNAETGEVVLTQIKYVVESVDESGYITGELPEALLMEEKHSQPKNAVLEESNEGSDNRVRFNEEKYILLKEAKSLNKHLKVGDELIIPLEAKTDFGRIAAQTAKQVIIQRLREVERDVIFNEFKGKEGEVVSGVIQRIEGRMIYVDLGRTNGIIPPVEQVPTERYRMNQRLRFFVVRVEESNRGPVIVLSRAHPGLVMRLFEFEVPEIESGSVEIKAIAREAGSRSKIAVVSNDDAVDPIGSLVGQRGVRVQTVINELGGEKIDIIEWHGSPQKFLANSLSPAKIIDVKILDEEKRHALVEVADDQFSLAIGKRGQNVRLAAKLTGWKIDVRAPQGKLSAEEAFAEEMAQQNGVPTSESNSEPSANDAQS